MPSYSAVPSSFNLPPGVTPAMIDALSTPAGMDDIDPEWEPDCACSYPCKECRGIGYQPNRCPLCVDGYLEDDTVCPGEDCEDGRLLCIECDAGSRHTGECPACRY